MALERFQVHGHSSTISHLLTTVRNQKAVQGVVSVTWNCPPFVGFKPLLWPQPNPLFQLLALPHSTHAILGLQHCLTKPCLACQTLVTALLASHFDSKQFGVGTVWYSVCTAFGTTGPHCLKSACIWNASNKKQYVINLIQVLPEDFPFQCCFKWWQWRHCIQQKRQTFCLQSEREKMHFFSVWHEPHLSLGGLTFMDWRAVYFQGSFSLGLSAMAAIKDVNQH